MTDSCSCVYVEGEAIYQTIEDKTVRARKCHTCCECGRQIRPGEKYHYFVGKLDMSRGIHKTCADCVSILNVFFCEGRIFGDMLEMLADHIRELDGNVSETCIAPLTEAAKDLVCQMIQEVFDELNEIEKEAES